MISCRPRLEQLEPRYAPATIKITQLPTYGVDGFLGGVVSGAAPASYRVAVYIQIEGIGWWTKPTFANPTVPINPDGTFQADVATGGLDNRATIFCAALVPANVTPPPASGAGRIPAGLAPVAIDCVERFSRIIEFAGRSWGVKEAPTGVGPGNNRFSNLPGDVFVDNNGLHLTIHFHDGAWWATEVVLLDRLGHGTYSLLTSSNVNTLDPDVTFGAFTWDPYGDDESGADPHREIDFEDSRWGNGADPTNAQEVVQPFSVTGNLHRYTIPDLGSDPALTRFFTWSQDQIEFSALRGDSSPANYPPGSVIDHYVYQHDPSAGHYVPTTGRESFRFNLWLNSGATAPANGQPAEVVIKDFTFSPAGSPISPNLPLLSVTPASGVEHQPIPLSISAALADSGGSEVLALLVSGVPANASLSAGTRTANGTWTLTPAQLSGLTLRANHEGDFTLTVTATATETTTGASATSSASLDVAVRNVDIFATGTDAGGGPNVLVFDAATGKSKFNFFAYAPSFTGGVRVATGDVTGDGVPDVITAPGPGASPDVHVYDGVTGNLLRQFFAVDPAFQGGLYLASGDVNGDGFADIVTGAAEGGGPNVAILDGKTTASGQPIVPLTDFFPFDSHFTGGVRVAAGDVNADGHADLICAAGPGGGPNVSVISGLDGQTLLASFFPYAVGFTGGLYVSAADVNGDGRADVVTGVGPGGGPNVAVIDSADFKTPLALFFPYDQAFTGGVRVGTVDRNGDGEAEVICVPGPGGGPDVRSVEATSRQQVDDFFAYGINFAAGLFVAGSGR